MEVRAIQGDTVDSLCYRHLGSSDYVEATLELNPGLADTGPILNIGQTITLPDVSERDSGQATSLIQLWD